MSKARGEHDISRVVRYDLDTSEVEILPLGDIHIGETGSYFHEAVAFVDMHPEYKLILLGDLIDNAIISSIGDVYSQDRPPHRAIEEVTNILRRWKERILGVVGGNHERRTWRVAGVDPIRLICTELGVPFSDDFLIVDVALNGSARGSRGRTQYSIVCHHGVAGGRFPERSVRQHRYFLERIQRADIYITGHTHAPMTAMTAVEEYDPRNKKVIERNILHVCVSAWVRAKYADQKLFPLVPRCHAIVKLYREEKKKEVRLVEVK